MPASVMHSRCPSPDINKVPNAPEAHQPAHPEARSFELNREAKSPPARGTSTTRCNIPPKAGKLRTASSVIRLYRIMPTATVC